MMVRAPMKGMDVGRFSRLLGGVGVLAMSDAGLDTMQRVQSLCEVPPCAGVPGMAVGVFIDRYCGVDGVDVTRCVISATRELFSEDEGVEFCTWIVEATELPHCEESLSPAGMDTRFIAVRS